MGTSACENMTRADTVLGPRLGGSGACARARKAYRACFNDNNYTIIVLACKTVTVRCISARYVCSRCLYNNIVRHNRLGCSKTNMTIVLYGVCVRCVDESEGDALRSPDREPDRRDRTVDCRRPGHERSTTPRLSSAPGGGVRRRYELRTHARGRHSCGVCVCVCVSTPFTSTLCALVCACVSDGAESVSESVGGAGTLPAAIGGSPPLHLFATEPAAVHPRRSSPLIADARGHPRRRRAVVAATAAATAAAVAPPRRD